MSRPRTDDIFASEYAVVALRPSWSLVALTCFLVALSTRYWVQLLPLEAARGYMRYFLMVRLILIVSALGTISGWVARRQEGSGLAKMGMFGNLIILVLSGLAALAIYVILPQFAS